MVIGVENNVTGMLIVCRLTDDVHIVGCNKCR